MKTYQLDSWIQCTSDHHTDAATGRLEHSKYKLHIYLSIPEFDQYRDRIYSILEDAVERSVIPAFKMLNVGNSQDLAEQANNLNTRIYNNPFTIYLHPDFYEQDMADLCVKIEDVLRECPAVKKEHLSKADLPLSDHTTFRQETLNAEYVAIHSATEEELRHLVKEAKESGEYRRLNNAVHNKPDITEKLPQENEKHIRSYYMRWYAYINKQLRVPNANYQFQAACMLLAINHQELANKDPSEWGSIIKKAYRNASLSFHPDKVASSDDELVQQQANDLFALTSDANELLLEIAKDQDQLIGPFYGHLLYAH